ncbi:MAG: YdiU family protein, partial [Pseudomonadota bacterium]
MFDRSSYHELPDHAYAVIDTRPAASPSLLAWNDALAAELGLEDCTRRPAGERARAFSGCVPDSPAPLALAYAGHQFGQFVPQLGDGRAALLGEAEMRSGDRVDIQLKGSGRTPFSRGGDGRSALGPVVREYLMSEAMHALGVPTTRALAAVSTGEQVVRQAVEPGGVFTRVASSHLRVGTFEYFASRGDRETLRQLADYAIRRHYRHAADHPERYRAFFRAVLRRQAALVAHWMSIGFIHGVMNTDNTSIAGETIDYGPCAFMDEFRHDKVFSSIDHYGRYAYRNQPAIAQWNLARLAETLVLLDDNRGAYEALLGEFKAEYEREYLGRMRAKLGLATTEEGDAGLVVDWLDTLEAAAADYTLAHRQLADRYAAGGAVELGEVEQGWRDRVARERRSRQATRELMNGVNPFHIPRNHRVEEAIEGVYAGDPAVFHDLIAVLAKPFTEQPEYERYA